MPKLFVHIRMAGNPDRTRFPKNAQLRVTLDADGHKSQTFTSVQGGVWQWVTRRMTKEIGRVCYFEIVDRSREGHIAVDKIVFSDSEEPPWAAPDPRVAGLLGQDGLSSLDALAGSYAKLYQEVSAGTNSDSETQALLAALSPPGSAEDTASPLLAAEQRDRLATLRQRRRTIAGEIPESAFGMISKDENPRNVAVHLRGSHQNLGEEAPRRFLQVIAGEDQQPYRNGSGRLRFAEVMTGADNPLAARVMVNRIWRHHFGAGIVATTDNFGKMGERPTHPKLLDFLAQRVIDSGWSIKAMHRMMLLSSTYRMSSEAGEQAAQLDPRNKLLHHRPVRRLEAEVIRDSVLAISGSLNRDQFGPGVPPHISKYQDGRGKPVSGPLDGRGRRSIYLQVRRNFLTPMFLAFDYPSPISTIGRRGSSTVPSQALIMMNNEFVNQQAKIWAERVVAERADADGRIQRMFLAAFGRPADRSEVEETSSFLGEQRALHIGANDVGAGKDDVRPWTDLAHVLMNSTEFIFVRRLSMHRIDLSKPGVSRREMLCRTANGFGGLALAAMLADTASSATGGGRSADPMMPRAPHFEPKAKSVIFLFMDGGPSQMDTFDPKPLLAKENGNPIKMDTPTTVFNISNLVLDSPFEFKKHGQCGADVSELFPHVATCVDDMAIIRSMVTNHSEHTAGNYFMHSGSGFQGRPSMGAWATYGLGSECDNLPGFVVMESGLIPPGGMDLFGGGFLPAAYQGTLFREGKHPIADIEPRETNPQVQKNKLGLLRKLNQGVLDRFGAVSELEATISNYELAFRMQATVPDLIDLTTESEATRKLYGLDEPDTEAFARQCLLARRMVQRGVRFLELVTPRRARQDRWDQHYSLIEGHRINAKAVDKPIAGLMKDLKAHGLLDQTLIVWGGEFGRTPTAQLSTDGDISKVGRDHNPFGFTMWMAGGGVKGGTIYGKTDEYGYFAIENKVEVHDLHATMLHLLGLDHKKLTFRFSGRDMRLTDVHGNVIHDLLA